MTMAALRCALVMMTFLFANAACFYHCEPQQSRPGTVDASAVERGSRTILSGTVNPRTGPQRRTQSAVATAAAAAGKGAPNSRPRVALCFFGLTRSLSVTRYSLRRHVLDVLTSHGWDYDVFLHTYRKVALTNPRSSERNVSLDTEEWRYLRPFRALIEDGASVDAEHVQPLLKQVLTRGDLWHESAVNHSSMANLLGQLRSIEQVTGLLQAQQSATPYNAVIFLRPDVWFFNDIDMREVERARASDRLMFIPEFHAVEARGEVNDRFAICHPDAAGFWGMRGRLVHDYVFVQNKTLHSEAFLGYALRQANITIEPSSILFGRVRANKVLWGQPGQDGMVVKPTRMKLNALGTWRT